jgi:hypothetical protein
MNKLGIITIIIFSFLNCQNFDSKKHMKIENEVIKDLILEMTLFEEMKKGNNWGNKRLKLFIVSTLDTLTASTYKPKGYRIAINDIDFTEEEIEKAKKEFEEDLEKYEKEEELFADLKNGKIKPRILNSVFKNEKLNIELIEKERIEKLENFETKENEFGYLFISRIIFNRNYTKGYLHFEFICGIGCAWDNNIEVKKVNGKWKITKHFSGGIA